MSFLMPLLGALIPGLMGGIAGATNTRPPSLDPTQRQSLDTLLPMLMQKATANPRIDPIQQQLMFNQIAQSTTGANNALTHALVSRGLGRSGLLGAGLIQNANTQAQEQTGANLGLQQQAIQLQQNALQQIPNLLNVGSVPGQSGAGGFFSGMAPLAAYSIQNMMNQRNGFNNSPLAGGYPAGQAPGNLLGGFYGG